MTKEERSAKIAWLLEGGNYSKADIAEIAEPWAREHSHNPEEESALYKGFMAGFEEGYGFGLQDAEDFFEELIDKTK